jgi:peptide/nickel transport system permease protein
MARYVLARAFAAVVVVIFVSVLVFLMIHLLPGDALLAQLGETGRIPQSQMDSLRQKMGLDQPIPLQYLQWVRHVFDGTLGYSLIFQGQTVSGRIAHALPVTMELAIIAMVVAVVIAVPLGVISAVKQDTILDYAIRVFSLAGISFPQFWIGIIVVIYGTLYLGYSPPGKYATFMSDPVSNLKAVWIPALVLGFGLSATAMRLTRSTMLEALNQDYVRTARAKGLSGTVVVYRHVLRNALIPVVTLVGNQAAFVFSGALILEVLFNRPGMGQLTYIAIQQRDYTQIEGNALVTASVVVLVNLIVDLSYGFIDPRLRYR